MGLIQALSRFQNLLGITYYTITQELMDAQC